MNWCVFVAVWGELRWSTPPHPVRCPLMASQSIQFSIFFQKEYLKTLLQAGTQKACLWNPNHLHLSYNLLQENILRRLYKLILMVSLWTLLTYLKDYRFLIQIQSWDQVYSVMPNLAVLYIISKIYLLYFCHQPAGWAVHGFFHWTGNKGLNFIF